MRVRSSILPLLVLAGCPKPAPHRELGSASIRLEHVAIEADSSTLHIRTALVPGPLADREQPVFLGVTVVTFEGIEIDLMVNELFPGSLGATVEFYAEVGAPVRDILIGAWDHKIEPCDVDRSGCKQFGFVLDGPLASWPPGLYEEGVRQRVPPAAVRLRIDATGGTARSAARAAEDALQHAIAPFGSTVAAVPGADPAAGARVAYADPHDLHLARAVAAALHDALGVDLVVVYEPIADADIAVTLPD